jgi:outer membrane receptor protein involved in Fe transport
MTAVRSLSPSTVRSLALVGGLAFASGPALLAVEPVTTPPEDEAGLTETVVVTASRIEQREEDVAANVTVVTEDEIEKAASFATDEFLRRIPGFSLFRRASSLVAHPTTQGVSLRGIGPSGVSRTLVLLDGVPLNDPFGGWVYWGRVPLATLERVELVRGGTSNVWGNSALGGVIHLFTRDPEPATLAFGVDFGTRSTYDLDALASNRWEKSAAEIHGDLFETNGFFVVPAEQRGAIDTHAFSEHWNLAGRYDLYPADSWTVSLRASGFDEDRGNGTPLTGNDTELANGSAQFDAVTGSAEWRGSVFYQDQTFASTFSTQALDRSSEVPALDQFDTSSDALGLGLQWVRSFAGDRTDHVLTAGGEARGTSGTNLEDFRLVNGVLASRRRAEGDQQLYGIFLQDTVSFHDRWQLQIGARGDRWESTDGLRLETVKATGAVTRVEHPPDRDETELSPRLALLWSPRDGVGLKASAYQAFRAPTINELFRPFRVRNDITEANAALEPESLTGAELGADFRGRRARLELTAFWNEVEDAIANVTVGFGPATVVPCGLVPAGGVCRQRQNLERTEIYGGELEFEVRPTPRWRFLTSYLYSDAEILEAPQQRELEGNRLAQVPESQGSMTLEWSDPRLFTITTMGRVVTEQFEDDLNSLELATAIVVDAAIQVPIGDRFTAFMGLENVTDERIESGKTADGLVTIGTPFIIHGGVRLHLGRPARAGA